MGDCEEEEVPGNDARGLRLKEGWQAGLSGSRCPGSTAGGSGASRKKASKQARGWEALQGERVGSSLRGMRSRWVAPPPLSLLGLARRASGGGRVAKAAVRASGPEERPRSWFLVRLSRRDSLPLALPASPGLPWMAFAKG